MNYAEFHLLLMGYDCYINEKYVPKWVLYWNGWSANDIIQGLTKVKLKERGKARKYSR